MANRLLCDNTKNLRLASDSTRQEPAGAIAQLALDVERRDDVDAICAILRYAKLGKHMIAETR